VIGKSPSEKTLFGQNFRRRHTDPKTTPVRKKNSRPAVAVDVDDEYYKLFVLTVERERSRIESGATPWKPEQLVGSTFVHDEKRQLTADTRKRLERAAWSLILLHNWP
jgi:hypothetical protein